LAVVGFLALLFVARVAVAEEGKEPPPVPVEEGRPGIADEVEAIRAALAGRERGEAVSEAARGQERGGGRGHDRRKEDPGDPGPATGK
jgi:hypothetical protein